MLAGIVSIELGLNDLPWGLLSTGKNMSGQFKAQDGVATMDPSPLRRWLSSIIISRMLKPGLQAKRRARYERQRRKTGAVHRVEYFHQVDDSYSHLAAQLLKPLLQRYDIELVCYLVSGPTGKNSPEPQLQPMQAATDASCIAPHYNLSFPELQSSIPDTPLVELASAILAVQDTSEFINCAAGVGEALWSGDRGALESLAANYGCGSAGDIAACLEAGNARRAKLGHYAGAMFYYAGEWYWGVDRLHYLETRLQQLGAESRPEKTPLAPRPRIDSGPLRDNGSLRLEAYISLRSPYTAISFDRAVSLARKTGVELLLCPVLPMVMRGVPVTREKGLYIFADAAREALDANVAFGRFYDPVGEPVRRCYSLYPWACEQGRGTELISSFLSCAFAEGVNTNNDKGLKRVVEKAGLDWQQALKMLGHSDWQAILESNRKTMYSAGLWGVPSFRLVDKTMGNEQIVALWGQDRLWLIAREIQSRLAASQRQKNRGKQ